jgi:hydrogenase maturation protease
MNGEPQPEVLVIGIGNAFRGDDAAGLEAVRALADRNPEGALLVESHGGGTELMEAWRGRSKVIIVDAMHSGSAPGAIVRCVLPGDTVPLRALGTSTHAFGVGEAIEFSREMGELPAVLVVFGIEGREFAFGRRMSPGLEARIPRLVELLKMVMVSRRSLQAA